MKCLSRWDQDRLSRWGICANEQRTRGLRELNRSAKIQAFLRGVAKLIAYNFQKDEIKLYMIVSDWKFWGN